MELRHLRCFVAVAEELHFARAPAHRAVAVVAGYQGTGISFGRTVVRADNTTHAVDLGGKVFLEEAHRIFAAIDQAKASVKAAATGYHERLRSHFEKGRSVATKEPK